MGVLARGRRKCIRCSFYPITLASFNMPFTQTNVQVSTDELFLIMHVMMSADHCWWLSCKQPTPNPWKQWSCSPGAVSIWELGLVFMTIRPVLYTAPGGLYFVLADNYHHYEWITVSVSGQIISFQEIFIISRSCRHPYNAMLLSQQRRLDHTTKSALHKRQNISHIHKAWPTSRTNSQFTPVTTQLNGTHASTEYSSCFRERQLDTLCL